VEDLFYNMDTRRRAFKNPAEQHAHILDVVTRYAVHYGDKGVAFACKVQCSSVCVVLTVCVHSVLVVCCCAAATALTLYDSH
jgi:hypothetical protein